MLGVLPGDSGFLQRIRDQAGGIPVALPFLQRPVLAFPAASQRRQAPASVRLLLTKNFIDDSFLLLRFEESGHFRGSPQEDDPIDGGLRCGFAVQVFAQQLEAVLDFGSRVIIAGGSAHGDRRQSGSIKVRIVRFPRLVSKPQPRPRALFISGGLLLCPHVIQRGARVAAELAALRVIAGEDQGVENGFGTARLDRFVHAAIRVAVERRDFLPKAHALGDIVQKSAFVHGRS